MASALSTAYPSAAGVITAVSPAPEAARPSRSHAAAERRGDSSRPSAPAAAAALSARVVRPDPGAPWTMTSAPDRKSTRLNSSHVAISYAVFCLKKKQEHDREL